MYQGILDQEVNLKSKQIVPYFGSGTKNCASSSHSHEKPTACHGNCQGKVRLKVDEVRHLYRRLDILEKDTQLMKKLFFGNVEERQGLLKEISHHLQTIEEHLRNSAEKGKQQKVSSLINAAKGPTRDAGLPQVLDKEENITVVTNRKVNIIALRDPTSTRSNDLWC